MCVGLTHDQAVLNTLKYLNLVNNIQLAPCEVSLSGNQKAGFPFSVSKLPKSCGFLLICVFVNYNREPQLVNIFLSEGIQRSLSFKIVIACSVWYCSIVSPKIGVTPAKFDEIG